MEDSLADQQPDWADLLRAMCYVVALVGTLLLGWLAWEQRFRHDQPFLVLLLVWLVSGCAHVFVRNVFAASGVAVFFVATGVAVFGSVLAYTILVIATKQVNEMIGVGWMMVSVLSVVFSRTALRHGFGRKTRGMRGSMCPVAERTLCAVAKEVTCPAVFFLLSHSLSACPRPFLQPQNP